MGRRLRTFVDIVSVAEVQGAREAIVGRHFTDGEREGLRRRHARTVAGSLALKRALAALCSELAGGGAFEERDFVLEHRTHGAPRLVSFPAPFPAGEVKISISHTRDWAYGLAVFGGDCGD